MLFVMEPKELSRRDTLLLHVIPTVLVFLAFMGVTLFSAYSARQDLAKENKRLTNQVVQSTEQSITDQVALYEEVLRAGVGLFNASDFVSRDEWHRFTNTFDLQRHYPGIQGLGYIQSFSAANSATEQDRIRNEGFPNYAIFPTTNNGTVAPLIYIEPFTGKNLKVFGYDNYSDTVRREGLDEARDTNKAVITKRVHLLQDNDNPDEVGLLMFLPVYKTGMPTVSVEEKRQALQGFVYAPFRARDFFGNIFTNINASNPGMQFQIFEGEGTSRQFIYQSDGFDSVNHPIDGTITSNFKINNRDLTINYRVPEESIARSTRNRPTNSLFGGLIFSLLLAGLVLVLLISRTRALAYAETREVQQAKDDLLSLASHQLRTPATGVKQYVGMLRQGYAGQLSTTQQSLLQRAYANNERQLGIIDEILHVARIDTGRITLRPKEINIVALLRNIVKEHREAARSKQQKLQLHVPKKPIIIEADPTYMRMSIENLMSNAIKYTEEKGHINVTLSASKEHVVIEVKDSGVGVEKHQQHLLFKKFSRIHNSLTRQTEGSGIGLYIANRMVELHHGAIEVESEPNIGSTFRITIPIKQPKHNKLYNEEE